ncbi:MAG: NAD-dependent epimerase/dehydratase family protein, partial [Candidatus Latescibacteria bacterium]|nr:NAD-dependent epimerase/dehydratase family protein [Candidatus Latescibacterota bacterium]
IAKVDLRDREGLTEAVKGVDAIIHLGVKLRGPTNFEQLDINTAPTLTLLEAARLHAPNLTRFVYGSSDTLYPHAGYMPDLITPEDIFTRPKGMYAVSKIAGEAMVQSYHQQYDIPTTSLTIPYTFCGREFLGERTHVVSPLIESHIKDLQKRKTDPNIERTLSELKKQYADGKRLIIPHCPEGPAFKRHWGDVRDVVTATECALDNESAIGKAFVIMSQPFLFDEAVPHLSKISNQEYVDIDFPFAEFYEYDMSYTTEHLGYVAHYDGKQMLEDAWRHKQGEDIGVVDVGPDTPTQD